MNKSSFWLFIASRVLIGIGIDALWVWQAPACEKWFSGRFLTIALTLNRVIASLLAAVTAFVMPIIFVKTGQLTNAVLFPGAICLVCFIGSFVFTFYDKKYENLAQIEGLEGVDKAKQLDRSRAKISHLLKVKPIVYPIVLAILSYPMMMRQFTNTMTDFITVRYGIEFIQAKNLSAFIQITRSALALIFSALFTKYGKRSMGFVLSPILQLCAHFIFLTLPSGGQASVYTIYLCVLMISAGQSLYDSTAWACFLTCFPSKLGQLGSAFLLLLANLNYTFLPIFLGWMTKARTIEAYQHLIYFLIGLCCVCLCIGLIVMFIDCKLYGGILMKQENDEAVRKFKGHINKEYEKVLAGESRERRFEVVETSDFSDSAWNE